jgi:hypothetical protein
MVVLVVLLSACRGDATKGTAPAVGAPGSAAPGARADPLPAVSDEELVAFTRWQRDYADLLRRQRVELEAVGSDDPNWVLRDPKGVEAKLAELVAVQTPVIKAQYDRVPLKGKKAELVTEVLGGIYHFGTPTGPFDLVVARDEVRLEAARRRFGQQPVDDIVAREPLILAALEQP